MLDIAVGTFRPCIDAQHALVTTSAEDGTWSMLNEPEMWGDLSNLWEFCAELLVNCVQRCPQLAGGRRSPSQRPSIEKTTNQLHKVGSTWNGESHRRRTVSSKRIGPTVFFPTDLFHKHWIWKGWTTLVLGISPGFFNDALSKALLGRTHEKGLSASVPNRLEARGGDCNLLGDTSSSELEAGFQPGSAWVIHNPIQL